MSTDNVLQFEERSASGMTATELAELEESVRQHTGIYIPIAAKPGQEVVEYDRVVVSFQNERPVVQVLVDWDASTGEVVTQLRRVIRWLKDKEVSELGKLDIDKPRMGI